MTSISLDLFRREQVGAVAAGLFESLLAAPFGDFCMIATDEDFGNGPPAKIGGARVVGKIEKRVASGQWPVTSEDGKFVGLPRRRGERFVLGRGFVAERAREKASDGIDDEGGGQFTATQDEIADGNFVGG